MINNIDLNLQNREWKEFEIGVEFSVINSKAYHKSELKETKIKGLAYVSRTNNNNGIESIVVEKENFRVNPSNTIAFGAENATFFYQPSKYVTGNKMYFIQNKNLSKHSGLFIQMLLNQCIKNCGFGYGKGLTGTRVQKRIIKLPINSQGNPDYSFMENYMKQNEQEKIDKYKQFVLNRLSDLEDYKEVESLEDKEWKEFKIEDVFYIKSGVRLTKADMKRGDKPFIGATDSNNGITEFTSDTNDSEDSNVLGVNYNGSVVETFYHLYTAIFSDDVKRLSFRNIEGNEHLYLFAKNQILKQRAKYQYGYKFNARRMGKQKIMLPINQTGELDYDFMENYMKQLEFKKLSNYVDYKFE